MPVILVTIGIWLISLGEYTEPYVFNQCYLNAEDSPINSTTPNIWFWRAGWENVSQQHCSYDEYNIVKSCNTTYVPMIHIKALTNNETLAKELGCVICHDANFDVPCPQVSDHHTGRYFAGFFLIMIAIFSLVFLFIEDEK
jgi:hypothetical protein